MENANLFCLIWSAINSAAQRAKINPIAMKIGHQCDEHTKGKHDDVDVKNNLVRFVKHSELLKLAGVFL
jgi:hypothetical protein